MESSCCDLTVDAIWRDGSVQRHLVILAFIFTLPVLLITSSTAACSQQPHQQPP